MTTRPAKRPLTKLDVEVSTGPKGDKPREWVVLVRKKVDSYWNTYDEAEARWAGLTRELPSYRG